MAHAIFAHLVPRTHLAPSVAISDSSSSRSSLFWPIPCHRRSSCERVTNKISSTPLLHLHHRSVVFCAGIAQTQSFPSQDIDEGESEEGSENGAVNEKSGPTLRSILESYKEAILGGDLRAVSEIETALYVFENENKALSKIEEFSTESSSMKDKYLRMKVDFENFRKRSDKDRLRLKSDAQGDVIESLLPMVDNFERAKQQIKPETEKEQKIDASYQGIYKQFVEIMRSLGVSVVETIGKPFDPSLHEAIAREESSIYKEGVVVEEFRRGFLLKDRLLRPAMVKVSSGQGSKKPLASSENSTERPVSNLGMEANVSSQEEMTGNN